MICGALQAGGLELRTTSWRIVNGNNNQEDTWVESISRLRLYTHKSDLDFDIRLAWRKKVVSLVRSSSNQTGLFEHHHILAGAAQPTIVYFATTVLLVPRATHVRRNSCTVMSFNNLYFLYTRSVADYLALRLTSQYDHVCSATFPFQPPLNPWPHCEPHEHPAPNSLFTATTRACILVRSDITSHQGH